MLFRAAVRTSRLASTLANRRFASSLVFLEQKGGKLNDAALCAVTAAQQVGGDVSRNDAGPGWHSVCTMLLANAYPAGRWYCHWLQGRR